MCMEMNLQTLFQDFNPSKFVVHSCLLIFTALLALKLDNTITWSYWAVFAPIWAWKFLVVLGATVGTYVWWQFPHFRLEGEAYIHYKAMLISLAIHLILLMFELLVCDQLTTQRHLWILVFIPLIFISIVSVAICIWSVKHDRSYELELFCAVNILQFIFLALKLDEFINWSWEVVFVPLWILMCLSLVGVLYSIIFAGILLRTPEVNIQQRRTSFNSALAYTFTVVPILVFQVLLTNKLDDGLSFNYIVVVSPLFVSYATLIIMSFSSKGGNKWWFGIRKDFCQFLLSVFPLLQEYANIAYNNNVNRGSNIIPSEPPPNQEPYRDEDTTKKKWISEETEDEEDLFNHCREMELVCYAVTKVVLDADNKWKGTAGKNNNNNHSLSNRRYIMELVNIQVLDQIIEYLTKVVKSFYKLSPKLARLKRENGLLISKHDHMFDKLCSTRFVMLQAIHGLIVTILNTCLHREDSRKLIESCLSLVSTYNQLLGLSYKKFVAKFNIGSNTYPATISETKNFTLTKIVQILAKSRAETNCQRLINCLVTIYTPEENSDSDSGQSSSDSFEIYHTLTKHMTPPASSAREMSVEKRREAFIENKKNKMKQAKSLIDMKNEHNKILNDVSGQNSDADVPYTSLLTNECVLENIFNNDENVNGILQSEEIYIEILLDTVAHMSPNLLGTNGVRKLKSGRIQASKKAAHKVTEYYQNILWGDVGSYLEHILLWWSSYPLATRSPNSSQNLREWLFQTFSANNTPDLVLSALRVLADSLGCHVTSTSWDKHFGATLTTNLKPTSLKLHPDLSVYVSECTESGAAFALMLQELVTLNNQCEVTWDYILGAPIEDLPIVEQIPILHRLDHSIHTYRLWCLAETRRLANLWEMDDFFRIAQNDMQACMEQLLNLRFADHTVTIEAGKIGVHENVCAKMREKLVSEVKVNIKKLKDATEEITAVLSSVCGTTSLAHLTMIFPTAGEWRRVADPPEPTHSLYVHQFLDKMLLPVINATEDITTLNMVLRIMCESWLHHIYVSKVKFSKEAAVQLLADFNEVKSWLNECNKLAPPARKQMLQNEVLRRCEGVGRLLLHAPGDLISMHDSTMQSAQQVRRDADNEAPEQLMPAEMYVPNQKQWLTLRAKKVKGPLAFTLCCVILS